MFWRNDGLNRTKTIKRTQIRAESKHMTYKQHVCNINGCQEGIYRNYMCKWHYEFYIRDEKARELSDDVLAVYEGKATLGQKLLSWIHNFVHHFLDIPMTRYEHFPLEHIYLNALKTEDRNDTERLAQVIKDFDIRENENISILQRLTNVNNVESVKIRPIEAYLFRKEELPPKWPLLGSLLGLLCIFIIVKYCGLEENVISDYFGVPYFLFRKFFYLSVILLVGVFCGLLFPKSYNNFAKRSYNLNLFDRVEDNITLLAQILYVKNRNMRADSYRYTLYGILTAVSISILRFYLSLHEVVDFYGVLIPVSIILYIVPIIYCYSISVLYFPIFESMKRIPLSLNLYHPDKMGGLEEYFSFLFKTFIYNETILAIGLTICSLCGFWWCWCLLPLLFIKRMNHAGACILMYLRSLSMLKNKKEEEIDRLQTTVDGDAMRKMEDLNKVHIFRFGPFIRACLMAVVIPYCVNHAEVCVVIIQDLLLNIVKFFKI